MNRFEDANALLTKMQLHVGHISALMNPLTYVIINLAIVALLYVGSVADQCRAAWPPATSSHW